MPDLVNPLTPFPILIIGDSNSVVGDSVRATVYSGSTARGTVTGTLNSDKEALLELANTGASVQAGDVLTIVETGGAIGGASVTITGSNAEVTLVTAAVANPSRSL